MTTNDNLILPPFLRSLPRRASNISFYDAIYDHPYPLGPSHVLWWPTKDISGEPDTVLLFLPGNPGLLDFYIPFLSAIHEKTGSGKLAILAHAHIDHTPGSKINYYRQDEPHNASRHGLVSQVEGAIQTLDSIRASFSATSKIIVVGHSIGTWISLQVLKARPNDISAVFLLFPVISHIASTPSGRKLRWLWTSWSRMIVSSISPLTRLIPTRVYGWIFRDWPLPLLLVLQTFLYSAANLNATMSMAEDEMETIMDVDLKLLIEHRHRLFFYYAETDGWVGDERDNVMRLLQSNGDTVQVIHDRSGVPHAFCINHGEQLAEQCHSWMATVPRSWSFT